MISLAVKYRPKEFEDVSSQNIIIKINLVKFIQNIV